jgi:hypothetical protein
MSIEQDALGALELLRSETLKKAFASVEADIMSEWQNSRVTAHVKREKLWMQLTALGLVKAKLQSMIDNGKFR